MAQQKFYYFYDVVIPYLVATWWRPYRFLLHFDLCNIPSVILYAIGDIMDLSHELVMTSEAEELMYRPETPISKEPFYISLCASST